MALSNYTELQQSIIDHLDRDDLSSHVPDFIRLCEARLKRDIRIRDMIKRDPITVNARQISAPTGFLESIDLRLLTDPITILQNLSVHEINRVRKETTGKPKYYTIHTEIEFDKTPDESYSGEIIFYKQFDALETTATNALLTRSPDVYLYGSLAASAPFLMHDERIKVWAEFYSEAKNELNKTDRRSRRSGPQVSTVTGRGP